MTSRSEEAVLRAQRDQLLLALFKARQMLKRYNADGFAEHGSAWEASGGVGKGGKPIDPPYKHDVVWLARIDAALEQYDEETKTWR
jgi:hypothetical protein